MEKTKRRRLIRNILLLILMVLIIAFAYAYFRFGRFVNTAAIRSDAGETAVVVPDGFEANLFASGLQTPRFIAAGPDGTIHVADRQAGSIIALPDRDGDGVADEQIVVAAEIGRPHSLIWHAGAWYVGIPSGVLRLTDSNGDLVADSVETVVDGITTNGSHTTRTVDFLPDGRMVLSVGSTCNVCDEEDPRRATILIYDDANGGGERIYATGLRNAVGLDVDPRSGELWASNNGRDLMGDDIPPETIYLIKDGLDYGWPVCHNAYILDPDMGREGDCNGVEPPIVDMQAHSAQLGIVFYDGVTFLAE